MNCCYSVQGYLLAVVHIVHTCKIDIAITLVQLHDYMNFQDFLHKN